MNEKDKNLYTPEGQSYYETGSTKPPKKRSSLILILPVVAILIGGVITAMRFLDVPLLRFAGLSRTGNGDVGFVSSKNSNISVSNETVSPTAAEDHVTLSTTPAPVENVPQAGGLSLQAIYEKAIPSVVSIACDSGTGSGVILSEDGYIVTNQHVVAQAGQVDVLLSDGRTVEAQVIGADAVSDLAVLQVEAENLIPAEFGDSDTVRVGDSVAAIGDPLGIGLRGTMTDGIISAINRDVTTDGRTMNLLQTNAALNNGNSGGPLLNCYGQVIGINTLKIGDSMNVNGVEGLGFAIPSVTVKEVVDQLISQGYVAGRPSLGITGRELSSFDVLYYRLPQGIYITDVTPNSDAARKGISPGDILLQLDDTRIYTAEDLKSAILSYEAGDRVTVIFYRNGRQYKATLTLDQATGGE